ncbi:MAG: hypothetical protein V3T31_10790 [candidate division Zixibacteria bacterium]
MSKSKPLQLTKQPKRIRDFIAYVREVCKMHDVELYLGQGSRIVYPDPDCSSRTSNNAMGLGCFVEYDEDSERAGKLMVATKRARWQWLGTLAHELSHTMQWLECEPTYTAGAMPDGNEASAVVDDWIAFKEDFDKRTVRKALQITVDCELDNEKRTVRMLRKFKLPVVEKRYIQSANSYLFFHQVVFENRTWYNTKMFSPEVIKHMPDHFLPEESYKIGKMPREFVEYLENIVINKRGWNWKTRKRS